MKSLTLALALCAACGSAPIPGRDAASRPTPAPVQAERAEPELGFVGVVAAGEVVDLAAKAPGVVSEVHVRVGDRVVAGQPVATLDAGPARDDLRAAQAAQGASEAELARARVDLEAARREHALEERAVADGVSPRAAAEEAAQAVRRAEAAVQQASSHLAAQRARTESLRGQLAGTVLLAPFAGQVALRARDPGATVARGEPVVRLIRDDSLVIRFAVPPSRAQALRPGADVVARVDSVLDPVRARVVRVSPGLDPASGLVIVEATAPGASAAALRPGLAATVTPL